MRSSFYISCCLPLASALACGRPQTATPSSATRVLDVNAARAEIDSVASAKAVLEPWLSHDAWMLHHGSTGWLRGRDTILDHLATVEAAWPKLAVDVSRIHAIEDDGWGVEIRRLPSLTAMPPGRRTA
jgi:hypothetical protein